MSSKRRADKELTSDNWDEEDEPEERGSFRVASEDVLKNRVIRTAKRRITNGAADVERSPIFSGFNAFGSMKKANEKKTGFSFVSNSLEGEDTVNTIKDADPKPTFSLGGSAKPPSFSFSKSTSSTSDAGKTEQPSLSFKGDTGDNANKLNTLSSKLKTVAGEEQTALGKRTESKKDDVAQTPDEIFVKKLRSLNLLCAEWIIKHLNENLSYILTPIFDDYKKHLMQLREERRLATSTNKRSRIETAEKEVTSKPEPTKVVQPVILETSSKEAMPKVNFGTGSFLSSKEKDTFAIPKPAFTLGTADTSGFKFFSQDKKEENLKTFNFTPSDTKSDSGLFKFKADSESTSVPKSTPEPITPSFFSFKPTTNPMFGQTSTPKTDDAAENEDEGPPVVEDVTIKEDGSVYDKKCKVFIKKDGNFIDHGVGFLFLKLVGDEQKCQLIVRANNKLANIIINVLLSAQIPVTKMGKNNVMIVCCPTPETKQPIPVLLKVKTSDDADELLSTLDKYRK